MSITVHVLEFICFKYIATPSCQPKC